MPSLLKSNDISFRRRFLGLVWHNPGMLRTLIRFVYRMRFGVQMDRRLSPGHAAPPARIKINLTRLCNLQCRMCLQDRNDSDGGAKFPWNDAKNQLPLEPWIDLLDEVRGFRPWIALTGGEPLMYPHFKEFIAAAKDRGLTIEFVTNGTLLHRAADFLVEQGVEFIFVSVDGPEEQHDSIRGQKGAFQRAKEGILALVEARKRLGSYGPIIGLNCTISKSNLAVIDQIVPLGVDLGVDVVQYLHTIFDTPANAEKHNRIFSPEWAARQGLEIMAPSMPEGEYYESEIGPEDLSLLESQLRKARSQAKGRIAVKTNPDLRDDVVRPYYLDLDYPFSRTCKCLWTDCRLLPDGTIIPCLHVLAGNITEQPLMDLWNGPKMTRFREIIHRGLFPACARCCCRRF